MQGQGWNENSRKKAKAKGEAAGRTGTSPKQAGRKAIKSKLGECFNGRRWPDRSADLASDAHTHQHFNSLNLILRSDNYPPLRPAELSCKPVANT